LPEESFVPAGNRMSSPVDRDSIAPVPPSPDAAAALQAGQLTPALVAEVTEKVYRLLLADLRLERERRR
jgi:hypothetical protein